VKEGKMIDIHTHILPHFDDGAKDSAMSAAMLKAEAGQGDDTVVLTSHYYGKKRCPADFIEKRKELFDHVKPHIPMGMKVRLGAEVHFSGVNIPEYEELAKLTIEGTNYILIEFPFTSAWTHSLLEKLDDFMRETDCIPIIAHAERYPEIWKRPALITELVEMGCLIQVNVSSFFNKQERKLAFAILKHGYMHCIGTDAHDMQGRSPDWSMQEVLYKGGYTEEWKRAQEIMQKVIAGEQVRVEIGKPIKKFFGKYF
jgi:protein-tyrosine phosphatase